MAQTALAWVLQKDGERLCFVVSWLIYVCLRNYAGVTAPIVGTTSLDNLRDLLGMCHSLSCDHATHVVCIPGAVNMTLTEDEVKYLEEPYQAKDVVGHT